MGRRMATEMELNLVGRMALLFLSVTHLAIAMALMT